MGRSASATSSTDADQRFTVVGAAALGVIQYAQGQGVEVAPLLAATGVDIERLSDPDFRLPQGTYNRLVAAFAAGDDCFGLHLAEHGDLEGFSVLGHLARRSVTFGEALQRIVRYSRIVHDAGRVEIETRDSDLVVYPGCRGLLHEYPRQVAEHAAASVVVLAAAILRRPLPVRGVSFRHAAPADTREHRRLFGVEPQFGAEETTVVTDKAVLAWPIPNCEPNLAALLERYADDLLARLRHEDDIVARTEEAIARRLEDGAPGIGDVARALGLSPRTLQRRLGELETSFQQILDSVRRSLAQRYVENSELSIQEVTFLLGFSETRNFHRAFQRWFGTTPGRFRPARAKDA